MENKVEPNKTIEIDVVVNGAEELIAGKPSVCLSFYKDYMELVYNFDCEIKDSSYDENLGIEKEEKLTIPVRDMVIINRSNIELGSSESIYTLDEDTDESIREFIVSIRGNSGNSYNMKLPSRKKKLEVFNIIKSWILTNE